MRRGAQMVSPVNRVIRSPHTIGPKRTCIRALSEQPSLNVSVVCPELLQLLNF
jgi:hypothetical protein